MNRLWSNPGADQKIANKIGKSVEVGSARHLAAGTAITLTRCLPLISRLSRACSPEVAHRGANGGGQVDRTPGCGNLHCYLWT
jgi:hypothetical protein